MVNHKNLTKKHAEVTKMEAELLDRTKCISDRQCTYTASVIATRGVQKVLQLDYKQEWKCYKLHFIFQFNLY